MFCSSFLPSVLPSMSSFFLSWFISLYLCLSQSTSFSLSFSFSQLKNNFILKYNNETTKISVWPQYSPTHHMCHLAIFRCYKGAWFNSLNSVYKNQRKVTTNANGNTHSYVKTAQCCPPSVAQQLLRRFKKENSGARGVRRKSQWLATGLCWTHTPTIGLSDRSLLLVLCLAGGALFPSLV